MDVGRVWGRVEVRRMGVVAVACAAALAGAVACGGDSTNSGPATAGGQGAGGGGSPGGGAPPPTPVPTTPGVWAEVTPPAGLDGFRVSDAFAVGTDDLFFVGSVFAADGTSSSTHVLRWSHGLWTDELTLPPSTGYSSLARASVHGTGPTDVWAVSGDQIFHRDAQGWSRFADESWRNQLRLPLPFLQQQVDLVRVRAGSPNHVWVAATSHILRWDGSSLDRLQLRRPDLSGHRWERRLQLQRLLDRRPQRRVDRRRLDRVGSTMEPGIVHHFDGTSFTRIGVGAYNVFALWRGGPGLLWAVNSSFSSMPLSRLEGTTAQGVVIAGTDPNASAPELTTLWGRGANDVWATGTTVVHFDGQQWSVVADAPPPTLAGFGLLRRRGHRRRGLRLADVPRSPLLPHGDGTVAWLGTAAIPWSRAYCATSLIPCCNRARVRGLRLRRRAAAPHGRRRWFGHGGRGDGRRSRGWNERRRRRG